MLQKIKNIVLAAMLPLAVAVPLVLAPAAASATCNKISTAISSGINAAASTPGVDNCATNSDASTSLKTIASKIVNLLSVIVGVVAVIMVIVGGFRYITSGGESGSVSGAKNTLIYAIVGLIIVALAQFIVHFVLSNVAQ